MEIRQIERVRLRHYHENLFPLYDPNSERYKRLKESIAERGILSPLIVHQIDLQGNFEILSGNNRHRVACELDLATEPCIVIRTASDEEARLIVIESNWQRSISEMTITGRAKVIAEWYKAIKSQGRRTDLLTEIEALQAEQEREDISENYLKKILDAEACKAPSDAENGTSRQIGENLGYISSKTGYSADDIYRYCRIAMLPDELSMYVNNGRIPFRAAVELSYLKGNEVFMWLSVILAGDNKLKITVAKAFTLRQLQAAQALTSITDAQDVLKGKKTVKPKVGRTVALNSKFLSQFFSGGEKKKDIEQTIERSLRLTTQTIPEIIRDSGAEVDENSLEDYIAEAVAAYVASKKTRSDTMTNTKEDYIEYYGIVEDNMEIPADDLTDEGPLDEPPKDWKEGVNKLYGNE